MSIQDTLGTLANNLRSASGYQNKLSLADMSSMATGLTTYNLLPTTSSNFKEINIDSNMWSFIIYQGLSLPAGIYTYSVYVDLAGFNSPTSNRIEWSKIGVGNTGLGDNATPVWGSYSNVWIQPHQQGLLTATFKLAVADTIKVGFSGNPYTKGTIKYSCPMLNVGTFPLPYTSNTLVRGGKNNLSFLMLSLFHFFERVVI